MIRKPGLHLTLCKSQIKLSGHGGSWAGSEVPQWRWSRKVTLGAEGREHLRGEVQSKVLEEMHDFVFWLAGRIVDICPGDCQARTDLYH